MSQVSDLKRWVEGWRAVGQELERMKNDELTRVDTYQSMLALSDAFAAAIANTDLSSSSGLVIQQYYFRRLLPDR